MPLSRAAPTVPAAEGALKQVPELNHQPRWRPGAIGSPRHTWPVPCLAFTPATTNPLRLWAVYTYNTHTRLSQHAWLMYLATASDIHMADQPVGMCPYWHASHRHGWPPSERPQPSGHNNPSAAALRSPPPPQANFRAFSSRSARFIAVFKQLSTVSRGSDHATVCVCFPRFLNRVADDAFAGCNPDPSFLRFPLCTARWLRGHRSCITAAPTRQAPTPKQKLKQVRAQACTVCFSPSFQVTPGVRRKMSSRFLTAPSIRPPSKLVLTSS